MSRTQTMAAFVSIWILTVSFVVPVPTVKALTAVGSITLSGEVNPKSALIDTVNGFAYFGTENSTFPLGSPGVIVKIRLSDFSLAGTLNLEPGQTPLHAAVIDTANGFAYFATGRIPSAIVKIRLSDFTLAASLTLGKGEDEIQAAVIDVANGFAYFAGHNATAGVSPQTIIVKVRLSDFTQVGTLKLSPEGFPYSATIDTTNGFAYVGEQIGVLPGVIVRVRLSDFTSTGVLSLNPGEALPLSAVIDSANGFAYFGTGNFTGPVVPPGIIVKVRLSDFTRGGALTLNPGEVLPTSAVIDIARGFAFFGTYTFPGTIVEVRLSDFTRVEAITLNPSTEGGLTSAVIDAAMGFAYYGGGHNIMRVATAPPDFRISPNLTTLTLRRGSSGALIISIASFSGFSGSVNLNASITPLIHKSPSITLSSANVTLFPGLSASMTVKVSATRSTAGDGVYTLTVTGSSGSLTHTVTTTVTITKT